jgi:hypothetical protein
MPRTTWVNWSNPGFSLKRYRHCPEMTLSGYAVQPSSPFQWHANEEKSRVVDLSRGESLGFLGFDFRRIRSQQGVWRVNVTPKLKKQTAVLRKLKEIFRRHRSQPIGRVIHLVNPV